MKGLYRGLAACIVVASTAGAVPAYAQAAQTRLFNIPSMPMGLALKGYSRATGRQILYSNALVAGMRSAAVTGTMTDDAALQVLLSGSNLVAARSPKGVIIIRSASRAQNVALAPEAPSPGASGRSPADAAPGADEAAPTEIIVTAQGREQRLQDVPLSATVTSGEDLQKSNIVDLQALGNTVANVRIASGPASDLLNIRGVGSGLNNNFEQSVGTFVDGVYRGRSRAVRAALFDVARVEILKGPQTTYFGNNAIAGALNITTREPGNEFAVNGSALYGSDEEYAVELGMTVPLSDTFAVRVAGKAYGMDGYIHNDLTGGMAPHQRDWIMRASAKWEPTDNFTSSLRVDRGRNRDDDSFPVQVVNCAPGTSTADPLALCSRYIATFGTNIDAKLDYHTSGAPSTFNYDFVEAAWRNELRLGTATLKSLTSYFDHKVDASFNLWPYPLVGVSGTPTTFVARNPEKYDSFSQEIRLDTDSEEPLSFTLGAYYSRGKLANEGPLGFFFAPFGAFLAGVGYSATSPIATSTTFSQRDETWSAFGAVSWRATDRLRINGALRYSIVNKEASRFVVTGTVPAGTAFPRTSDIIPGTPTQQAAANALLAQDPAPYVDPDRTDRRLMPSVNLQYEVNPETMTYVSYTRGFKAGGFSAASSINQFGPETVDAYEAGIKTRFLDNRVTFNLALFWNDFKDLQEASSFVLPNGSTLQLVQNAARARARGVEVNAVVRLTPELSVKADLAYLDAKYTSFPNGPCRPAEAQLSASCRQDLSGQRRAFAPEFSGSVGLGLAVPVGGGTLSFDPSVYFTSRYSQQVNNDPIFYQPGYAKLDARLAYGADDRSWEVAVIGKNLTNEKTASFRNALQNFGTITALVERDRSVAVQVSFRR